MSPYEHLVLKSAFSNNYWATQSYVFLKECLPYNIIQHIFCFNIKHLSHLYICFPFPARITIFLVDIFSASQVMLVVKNSLANVGDIRNVSLILGSGRSPREQNGNPFQYSCLENPMDRGSWWSTVYGVAKSWTHLKLLNTLSVGLPWRECK